MSYRFIIQYRHKDRVEYVNHIHIFFSMHIWIAFNLLALSHLCTLESTHTHHASPAFLPTLVDDAILCLRCTAITSLATLSFRRVYSFFSLRSDSKTWKTTNADKNMYLNRRRKKKSAHNNYRVKREWKRRETKRRKEAEEKKQIVFAGCMGFYKTLRFGQKQLDDRAQLCKTCLCETEVSRSASKRSEERNHSFSVFLTASVCVCRFFG